MTPVQPQGKFSYTVAASNDTVIVQFRGQGSPLQVTAASRLLSRTHGELVAPPSHVGSLGEPGNGLEVYKMTKLPGVNFWNMAESLAENPNAMMTFVDSLAKCVRGRLAGRSVSFLPPLSFVLCGPYARV